MLTPTDLREDGVVQQATAAGIHVTTFCNVLSHFTGCNLTSAELEPLCKVDTDANAPKTKRRRVATTQTLQLPLPPPLENAASSDAPSVLVAIPEYQDFSHVELQNLLCQKDSEVRQLRAEKKTHIARSRRREELKQKVADADAANDEHHELDDMFKK